MKGRNRTLLKRGVILTATLLIAAGIYVRYAVYYENRYFLNTIIGGEDCSGKTPVEAEFLLYEKVSDYVLEVSGREGLSEIILPNEIGMQYIFDDSLRKMKKEQNPVLWIMGLFQEYNYDMPEVAHFDEAALQQRIEKLVFFQKENIRAPRDAYISYSEGNGEYVIVNADQGTELNREKAEDEIKKAILSLNPGLDLDESGCYKTADLDENSDSLSNSLKLANHYISARVTYDWNGNEVLVDSDRICRWLKIDKDKVELDEKAIRKFVARQSEEYDNYGKNRIFRTTDGREIDLNTGLFGWLTDQEAETAALIKTIKNGETIKKQPTHTEEKPLSWQVWVKDTYVEIDLGKQHLYLYIDGELVLDSDFVSGNASRGWGTPAGVFALTYKTQNAVLRGANYETPVSYWMPFNGNIGMHDATWRASFGGSIYRTNGSHGCINLPYEQAKKIYEYIYPGCPVVCYY